MRVTSKNTGSDYLNVARKGGHHKGWFLGALPSVRQVSFTLFLFTSDTTFGSLRATSSFGGCREKYTRERHARRDAFSRGLLRSSKFPIAETIREIGTSFRRNDLFGSFGRTSVTCDWLMVALSTVDQS